MNVTDLIKLLADKLGVPRDDIELEIDGDDVNITIPDGAENLNDDREEPGDDDSDGDNE